jgi:hypothetical protein
MVRTVKIKRSNNRKNERSKKKLYGGMTGDDPTNWAREHGVGGTGGDEGVSAELLAQFSREDEEYMDSLNSAWTDEDDDEPIELKGGWTAFIDKKTGRLYYLNPNTNKTTWEAPNFDSDGDDDEEVRAAMEAFGEEAAIQEALAMSLADSGGGPLQLAKRSTPRMSDAEMAVALEATKNMEDQAHLFSPTCNPELELCNSGGLLPQPHPEPSPAREEGEDDDDGGDYHLYD